MSFLRHRNVFMRLQNIKWDCRGVVLSVIKGFMLRLYQVFIYNSGLGFALGNICLIGTLTEPKALKSLLTYLRILPQTQQPLIVSPSIHHYIMCKL